MKYKQEGKQTSMTDKVQKMREELARLKEETSIGLSEHENGVEQGRMEIINTLSIFLDSLQEEPVSEDLEEEIKQYLNKEVIVTNEDVVISKHHEFHNFYVENLEEVARHFANWQKQQMIKGAVECDIEGTVCGTNGNFGLARIKGDYKYGDKVKVLVIKED